MRKYDSAPDVIHLKSYKQLNDSFARAEAMIYCRSQTHVKSAVIILFKFVLKPKLVINFFPKTLIFVVNAELKLFF